MINENGQNGSDFSSMFDLFRSEVKSRAATLHDSLLVLKNNPGATDRLEALMQNIHPIKGGAKIVEIDAIAQIAQVMEECFAAAQQGNVSLGSEQFDILLKGVDMLIRISEAAGEGTAEWVTEHQKEIDGVVAVLKSILKPGVTETEAAYRDGISSKESMSPTSSTVPNIADASMLEMFRSEVESHTAVLNDSLLELENNPGATNKLEALMRSAHSIKGGARIVGLDAAVKVAHVMEDCFVAAQKRKISLESDHIDVLLTGVDMLVRISKIAGIGAAEWLASHQEEIEQVIASLSAILTAKSVTTVSPGEPQMPPVSDPLTEPASPSKKSFPEPTVPLVKSDQSPAKVARATSVAEQPPEAKLIEKTSEDKDRMVRVTATKIERLMGLGGEVVVSSRWLPSFSQSLLTLKKGHNELFTILEKLRDILGQAEGNEHTCDLVLQAREKTRQCNLYLADSLNQLDMYVNASANLSDRLYHEVIGVRMRPFADGIQHFPRMIRDLARDLGKKVRFDIAGKSTEVDRDILEKLDAPLTHLLRNAVDHGIESPEKRLTAGKPEAGTLRLEAVHRSGMLMITVADDGKGINLERLRQKIIRKALTSEEMVAQMTETELMNFLFLPGFSTTDAITEISGRGVGLDVVQDMVHEVGGIVRAVSKPGEGVMFFLELPLTLSVIRTFLVEIAEESYAFPLARIDRCVVISKENIEIVEDRQYFRFDENNISLIDIHDVLEMEEPAPRTDELPIVVVSDRSNSYGLLVDKFVGEYDLVVHPLDPRLGNVPDIGAAAVMLDGSPVLIFDVEDLVRSVDNVLSGKRLRKVGETAEEAGEIQLKRILVVDDSITVRETERKLLENRDYEVEVAVDGMEGWNAVRTESFDLIVSDIDMPRMNGIELVTNIKQDEDLKSLPVIIISYKDTEEHRLRGLQAGADYYLTKSSFQDNSFINAVVDLIGEA